MAAQADGKDPVRGRAGKTAGAGQPGKDPRGAEKAPGRAGKTPPGRQQMGRHRRHQPVRRLRREPGRGAHDRPVAQQERGEGLGKAGIPQPGRLRGAGHPQHQAGPAPAAPVRPHRARRRAGYGRHHPLHRAQRRAARHQDAPGAGKPRQGAAVLRYRRVHGPLYQTLRGAVLRRPAGVQASGIFLLPQLRLRVRVEGQPAPLGREVLHLGRAAQVRQRLQGDLYRRRRHEPL